ncbi:MAG TPA: relaxase domain-containing protein [Stellaceae bacterium]|nr:relaxase domain-containing protein [Stellaceae bacterium]
MTYRVGACASPSAGKAMAEYYLAGTLRTEPVRATEYYTGAEAREERAAEFWRGAIREGHLAAAGTLAELRPDLSPALAARLGIANPERPLTQAGIANLLNATRVDGSAIPGRKKHNPTRSVAEMFGLDPRQPPSVDAIRNVLAGKRADGGMPQTEAGKALPAAIVEGARKRFKASLGVPAHREATTDELVHLENGRLATGRLIDMADYRRQIHATRPPVGFVDMTFSADKSLSVAWALAPTEAERAALLEIHRHAVADTMAYAEMQLGVARRGQGGGDGVETADSDEVGRAFRLMSATCSDRSRPAVPIDVGRGGGSPAGRT